MSVPQDSTREEATDPRAARSDMATSHRWAFIHETAPLLRKAMTHQNTVPAPVNTCELETPEASSVSSRWLPDSSTSLKISNKCSSSPFSRRAAQRRSAHTTYRDFGAKQCVLRHVSASLSFARSLFHARPANATTILPNTPTQLHVCRPINRARKSAGWWADGGRAVDSTARPPFAHQPANFAALPHQPNRPPARPPAPPTRPPSRSTHPSNQSSNHTSHPPHHIPPHPHHPTHPNMHTQPAPIYVVVSNAG